MRANQSLLALALCLSLVNAIQEPTQEQQKQQQQEQQKPEQTRQPSLQQPEETPFNLQGDQPTDEQLALAKQGIQEILSKVPVQRVEPLFDTMAGYCEAFSALCSLACKERRQSENVDIVEDDTKKDIEGNIDDGSDDPLQQQEPKTTGVCANTAAKSVALAGASCECLGYSLTDRVNFAIIGGIVSLKDKPTANFAAEGFLDGLSFLPKSPIFMSIIHVMQTVCGYVTLLANISSPPEAPAHHDGGFLGTIAGLVPGLANLIPGVSTVSGLLPMFGGLVGGSGAKPESVNNENKSNGEEANVVSTKTSTAAPAATTAAKASGGGGIFGWLSHLFMETEGPEQQILGSAASASAPAGNSRYEQENSRLVSKDGKIAQITRIQKRKNKTKTVITAEKQHAQRRDDL